MFETLWNEWLHFQFIIQAEENAIEGIDYDEYFRYLSETKRTKFLFKNYVHAEKRLINMRCKWETSIL